MSYFFASAQRQCSRSPPILITWVRRLAFSVCCIRGDRNLLHHPHVHCVVPAGGLSEDHSQWKRTSSPRFFLNVEVLSRVFRGKFKDAIKRAFRQQQLSFYGQLSHLADRKHFARLIQSLYRKKWVVYAKPPFGGPEHVLHYLARYTHRIAISNHRLLSFDGAERNFPLEGITPITTRNAR